MKRARFNEAERRVLHSIANAFEQVGRQPGGIYNLTGCFGFVPGGAAEQRAFASLVRKKLIKRVRSEGHFQYQLTNKGVHLIARPFIRQVARHTRTGNPRVYRRGSHRGDFFRVTVSSAEVFDFSRRWPGSGMADKAGFGAEFNADTGDLVDLDGWPATDEANDVDQSALSALIDDMRDYGMKGRKKGQFWEDKPAGYRKRNPRRTSNPRKRNPAGRVDPFTASYIQAALWASTDEDGAPLDQNYDGKPGEFSPEAWKRILSDAAVFQRAAQKYLRSRRDEERAGHDFFLTRNGHGAGFWDGDWPEPAATALTKLSKRFGESQIYVGDDGKLHLYQERRRRNPAPRGRKRRKIVSQAQWRALAAKMNRGEISRRAFDDMVGQSRPFMSLPKRKGSRRRNPSEKDINEEFEYLAGGPDRAFRIMRLSQRAREAVSGDQYNLSRRPRSVKDVFKAMAKREGHPQKAVDYYARHFM